LSKLREYHGAFKSICESFSIDPSEFSKIFGSSQESEFKIWDTDSNRLIDSLELFTGLTVFSNSEFEEKIRFLFDLYDFNELNSLSNIDIQFMIVAA
jgi:Ca2+-binding EF-hand superfamily protein